MERAGHKNVSFFVGPEVELTPAYSKRTLFVVGKQPLSEIERLAKENKTTHIFLGANHSFSIDPTDATFYWNKTIVALLGKGFWVTLDYQAHEHKSVLMMLEASVWQSRTFVPLLSVRIPQIQTSGPNLTIKFDDVDFNATNPGVWCHHFHEVTDNNRFTGWGEYGSDVVLSDSAAEPVVATMDMLVSNVVAPEGEQKPVSEVLNDASLGLDVNTKSSLRPEANTESSPVTDTIKTPEAAADAYTAGTTSDSLSAEESTKVVKKVKKVAA